MGENDDILSKAAELLTRVGTDTVWEVHCDEFYNNTHMVGAVAKWAAGDLRPTAEDGSVLLWSVFAHDESSFPVGAEPEARLASMAPALARLGKEQSATITRLTRERDAVTAALGDHLYLTDAAGNREELEPAETIRLLLAALGAEADEVTRLGRERDDLRVDAEVLSDRLDSMREERDEADAGLAWVTSDWTPVEDAVCPVCGGMVKWSCGTGKYPHGRAECQDGRRVSRRWPGDGEPCAWHGAPTVRVRGSVRVKLTDNIGEFAEVRALADAYIDLVNRTARALGIPEVDEDGATPSLHDVPERVAEVVDALRFAAECLDHEWRGIDAGPPLYGDQGVNQAHRRIRQALDAMHDEPTDDDAAQDPPGWGGGEVSDGE